MARPILLLVKPYDCEWVVMHETGDAVLRYDPCAKPIDYSAYIGHLLISVPAERVAEVEAALNFLEALR